MQLSDWRRLLESEPCPCIKGEVIRNNKQQLRKPIFWKLWSNKRQHTIFSSTFRRTFFTGPLANKRQLENLLFRSYLTLPVKFLFRERSDWKPAPLPIYNIFNPFPTKHFNLCIECNSTRNRLRVNNEGPPTNKHVVDRGCTRCQKRALFVAHCVASPKVTKKTMSEGKFAI